MAQLTWRNVDAPNFSGSLEGIRTFGNLMGNATKGLSDALSGFQQADQGRVGGEIMQRALQYSDPAAYQKALADGTIIGGVDPSRVDPKLFETLGARSGDLARQQQTIANTAKTNYDFTRQVDGDQRLNAADAALRALDTATRSGDQRAVSAALQNPALQGLRIDQYQDVVKNANAREGEVLGNQGKVLSNTQASYGFGKQLENDAATKEATDFMLAARQGSVSDRQYNEMLSDGLGSLSPAAQRIVGMQLGLGQGGGTGSRGSLPSAPGTAGTREGNDYDVMYGFKASPRPLTTMTLGEVRDYQTGMIKDQGNSPVGRYQINQMTLDDFAPKVFGKDWRSVQMTPENQDKLGEAIFNARKGGNLKDTWAALPNSTVGAYKDMTWNQVKDTIAQAEVGSGQRGGPQPQADVRAIADLSSRNVQNRVSQEAVNSLTADFDRAVTDNRSIGDVVNEALSKEGKFAGADRQWLTQQIELGQEYGRDLGVPVSPAMAVAALSRAGGSGRTSALGRGWDALTSWVGGGPRDNDPNMNIGVNPDRYKSIIRDEYAAGKVEERVAGANYRTGLAASIQEARKAADEAAAELSQARAGAVRNPRLAAGIPRLEQRLLDAQGKVAGLTMQLQDSTNELAAKRKVEAAPKQSGTVQQRTSIPKGTSTTAGGKVSTVSNPFSQPFNPDDLKWID
ncbi:hypothetical protein Axy13_051 [Achromobacter phage vB_AxyP_19-32_Axy13]|uniref:Uncharacterized protein n=1 Tax=Achromobacter phage vB_AxyP_19-32_Axy13 TaxID=2591044 RepID=A0A514CUL9_9CAUD|nr:hypothetical protein Axy13_051 [Achromobacter phage vB_AxyP_19-32_Axy13]